MIIRREHVRRAGRAGAPTDPRRAARGRAPRRRHRRAARTQPAHGLEAPPGPPRRRHGRRPCRRAASLLPPRAGRAGRARRVAGPVPEAVGRQAGRPRGPLGEKGAEVMSDGTIEQAGGMVTFRYERHLAHPVETVWRAITDPAEIEAWTGSRVEIDLAPGGQYVFHHQGGQRVADRVVRVAPPVLFDHTLWADVN